MNQDRKHILIADDEERILSSLSMALENIGYDVSTASSGSEAMEKLLGCIEGSRPVDLLISDIQMAGMNGLELLDKINDSGLEIPVMVITGFGDKGMVVELMRKGCADYIDKPLEPVSFTNRVQAVLNSSSKRRNGTVESPETNNLLSTYRTNLERLRTEIFRAADAYRKLVSINPNMCRTGLAIRNRTVADCGGDFFDFRNTQTGCDFLLADVAGHDLSASYHTILLKAFFDENNRQGLGGKQFLEMLNSQLIATGDGERMITALFVRMMMQRYFSAVLHFKIRQHEVLAMGRSQSAPGYWLDGREFVDVDEWHNLPFWNWCRNSGVPAGGFKTRTGSRRTRVFRQIL